MKSLKQYSIPYTGLKIGHHEFNYEVGGLFFKEFEYSLVKNGTLKVDVFLEKQETLMVLDFHVWGLIEVNCDKCLSDFPYSIDTKDRLIAKFTESDELSDTEEVITLSKKDIEIDVSSFIYEIINLAAPYVNVCEDPGNTDACDQETLAKLEELSTSEEDSDDKDPRWDILKSIRKN
ncbi:hypothetical protein A5893_12350 [Pedobacter psychrophilus]|uniref:DNA-binding protein n=1 Tax=Pedobacter psychrophilus TaxID=1826909 RepID=A0A179DEB0_9SPHI|nr:DUF177 domain-containing protein [Pedobacter psychrophilus]OAQ38829.1 hypothetical protein A5893_12350 [Pedobacter psychrophilus]